MKSPQLPVRGSGRRRRLILQILALVLVTLGGTVGYRWIEDASWEDALFMTFITLSTVGYGEAFPLSRGGRWFTMGLIAVGMVLVLAVVGAWVQMVFEGEIEKALGKRRFRKVMQKLNGHFIVCGYGRFGRRLVEELLTRGEKFIVIDDSAELPPEVLGLRGDATEESVLREAGVERATTLLAALPSDANNVYITLTAKELNPDLFVVSRCEHESGEGRLRRAGADRVVAPYAIGGHRMVELALHPLLVEFGDIVTAGGEQRANIAEINIGSGSSLDGLQGASAALLRRYGVLPIGVVGADGRLQVGVSSDFSIRGGTTLVVFGTERAVEQVAEAGRSKDC